jgi:hypothetical protein
MKFENGKKRSGRGLVLPVRLRRWKKKEDEQREARGNNSSGRSE